MTPHGGLHLASWGEVAGLGALAGAARQGFVLRGTPFWRAPGVAAVAAFVVLAVVLVSCGG